MRRSSYFLLLALLAFMSANGTAVALSQSDRDAIYNDSVWYKLGGSENPPITCGSAAGATEALAKQSGLDKKWADLIIEKANKYGTDPLAMASILYWENRGWPPYRSTGWSNDPSNGMGPWQFIQSTWENNFPEYTLNQVNDPIPSTDAAARFIKSAGGVAGATAGSIDQDFGEGKNIKSMATVMKVYNAGAATYRNPAVAQHNQPGRIWYAGSSGNWDNIYPGKSNIIDDYIVAGTYLYYQIGSGQVVTYKDTASYIQEALTKIGEIKGFKLGQSGSSCPGGPGGAVAGSIVQTAVNFSWPDQTKRYPAKPSYAQAINRYNSGDPCDGADCGVFVATVMRASGADPSYPLSGTSIQENYVKTSGKYDWMQLGPSNTVGDLQPGDILIVNAGGGAGADGHTYIFVGNQPGGYNAAGASWCGGSSGGHMPWLTGAEINDSLGRGYYLRARLK